MHKVDVSIVIPTLNEEKYLPRLLKSIRVQKTECKFEMIIVDGFSSDRTVDVAKQFSATVLIVKSNIAEARNIGGLYAKGRFLLFLDADTAIPQGFLSNLKYLLEDGVKCAIFRPEPLEYAESLFVRIGYTLGWILCRLRLTNPCYMGLVIERGIFISIGGFDTRLIYSEDLDFLWKVSRIVKVYYPKRLSIYSSTRRWMKNGRLRFSECFKMALRVIQYMILRKSGMEYPIYR
ncbi:glycosyltransferase [Candidatus Bathyarchaeota archaeon]|nr:glycosyltransferase [Candidatus Bathyarchaeota archaeon]MBS7613293.1 glycosyltransferase [Candidatus Bathyarchaeota archaeon]MBS7618432.1 glycosyltransferase [Candidatus Bathyarchaeota archaeon]